MTQNINHVLDTLASADMLIDNLKNKLPVLHTMFKVALESSDKLKICSLMTTPVAYIFKQQELLVDEHYQLPQVESLARIC